MTLSANGFPHLRFLLRFYLALVGLFVAAKPVFMLMNGAGERGVSLGDMLAVIGHGLPLDLATAAYFTVPLWLGLFLSLRWVLPFRRRLYLVYVGVLAVLLSAILVGDTCLYAFWDIKLDGTVFAYIDSPRGAAASVSTAYLAGAIVAFVGVACGIFLLLRRLAVRPMPAVRRPGVAAAVAVVFGGMLFLAIRGGVGKSTANVGMVYFSDRQFLNHSAVNPAFSIFSSLLKTRDFAAEHNVLPETERAALFATLGYGTATSDADTSAADTLLTTRRPNVVIILMEGCGATFVHAVDSAADADITPGLNRLADEGLTFTRCYANSFRTDRGTVCALSGYPSFPDVSVMKLPGKCGRLPGIAASLRRAGYSTEFLYGGDINFTNTSGYLLSTGYEQTFGDKSFTAAERATHNWGVTDSITFDRLYDRIMAHPAGRPWHIGLLTLASHEPWDVPYDRIAGDKVANAMAYLDHHLMRFVERLRRTPQWDNTLVVILPDHGIGYPVGIAPEDPRRCHIPLVMVGGALRGPKRIDSICNQSDLPATLLALLGLPHDDYRFSRNVLSGRYRPSAVHTWSEGYLWIEPSGTTAVNLVTQPHSEMYSRPAPSRERRRRADAFLQTAYDDLGGL